MGEHPHRRSRKSRRWHRRLLRNRYVRGFALIAITGAVIALVLWVLNDIYLSRPDYEARPTFSRHR